MARTGVDENRDANTTYKGQANTAFGKAQSAIGEFEGNQKKLRAGQDVGANPWKSADYLANVNKLEAGALNAETNAGADELARLNLRTGGLNTGATAGAIRDLKLQKMRLADSLGAQRYTNDFSKNLDWQRYLAGAPLAVSDAESPYYSGAVSGRAGALKNLTDLGIASYGPWNAAIQAGGQAAGAALTPKKA